MCTAVNTLDTKADTAPVYSYIKQPEPDITATLRAAGLVLVTTAAKNSFTVSL